MCGAIAHAIIMPNIIYGPDGFHVLGMNDKEDKDWSIAGLLFLHQAKPSCEGPPWFNVQHLLPCHLSILLKLADNYPLTLVIIMHNGLHFNDILYLWKFQARRSVRSTGLPSSSLMTSCLLGGLILHTDPELPSIRAVTMSS